MKLPERIEVNPAIVLNIRARDQSPRFGLAKRLGEDFAADVDNGPDRPSHPISLPFLYLVSTERAS
jgi:hypothetical protein